MALKKITDKNFLPSKGVKAIPVYSEFFNESYDAIYTINARAHHSMSPTYVLKHPLMAVAVWDYATHGGATGIVNLNGGVGMLPDNAIVRNVFYDIETIVHTSGSTGTMIFQLPTDGTLLSLTTSFTGSTGNTGATGMGLGTPQNSTSGTWVKTTASRGVQVDLTGTGPTFIGGKVYCFIEYVVSELDAGDLTPSD